MKLEYVVCIKNKGYLAALELRKIYKVISDQIAEKHDQIRVIDESGEDYVYPASYFIPIKIPKTVEKVFTNAA